MPAAAEAGTPLTAGAFAGYLEALGPFEPSPLVAVGVSGGADSLALVLLADRWARARGGRVLALTVDHGLRPEAADEACQVGRWLAPRGIAHRVLAHTGPRPSGAIQAAARDIRYRLLLNACREAGCLHLLLAHHCDDQAETFLLRLVRGSGLGGLAGMAAVSYRPEARLLRPLLDVSHATLEAFLRAEGQEWIEDPSNRDPGYTRVRLRESRRLLAAEGLDSVRLAATANRLGRARQVIAAAADSLLARAVVIDPRGWAWLDPELLRSAPDEVGLRVLADLLCAVGGRGHPPRADRLDRVWERLGEPATLHSCRIGSRGDVLLLTRENRGIEICRGVKGGDTIWWDGRFHLRLAQEAPKVDVGPLRESGWCAIADSLLPTVRAMVPVAARTGLLALFDAKGLLSVPHLGYNREGGQTGPSDPLAVEVRFAPMRSAGSIGFRLARGRSRLM